MLPARARSVLNAIAADRSAEGGTVAGGSGAELASKGSGEVTLVGEPRFGSSLGGGTHTGPAFNDFLVGSLPAATGRTMRFTGTTVLRVENGRIAEEIGLDDGVTALQRDCGTA